MKVTGYIERVDGGPNMVTLEMDAMEALLIAEALMLAQRMADHVAGQLGRPEPQRILLACTADDLRRAASAIG